MSPPALRRYRAERLLEREFEGLRARVLGAVRSRLRASGVQGELIDLDACYAIAWQGLYAATLEDQAINNPAGWLAVVTFRRALDEHRSRASERPAGDWVQLEAGEDQLAIERDLAQELDDRDRLRQVFEALRGRLSEQECQAAALCYLQGLPRAEAAARLGISTASMTRLMDGRGSGRPGVSGKVGELLRTIHAGGWCEEQGSLMRGLAFGVLDPDGERHRVALAHTRECPACRTYVASLRGLAAVLPPVLLPLGAGTFAGVGAGAGAGAGAGLGAGTGVGGGGVATGAGGVSGGGLATAGGAAGTLSASAGAGGGWLLAGGSAGVKLAVGCVLALGLGAGCVTLVSEPPASHVHGRAGQDRRAGAGARHARAVPAAGASAALAPPGGPDAPRRRPSFRRDPARAGGGRGPAPEAVPARGRAAASPGRRRASRRTGDGPGRGAPGGTRVRTGARSGAGSVREHRGRPRPELFIGCVGWLHGARAGRHLGGLIGGCVRGRLGAGAGGLLGGKYRPRRPQRPRAGSLREEPVARRKPLRGEPRVRNRLMRVAVIGHVEWVDFVLVDRLPRPGEITHARELFGEPAGGGGVAAVQLARLAGESVLVTALGTDEYGRRARERLGELGVRVIAAERETRTRRALTFVDGSGERTIVTLGARLEPASEDALPWQELEGMDAAYFTAGDLGSLRIARAAAHVLVASPRGRSALGHGVPLDALVLSDDDAIEQQEATHALRDARLRVFTQGERGGYYTTGDGDARRWQAAALPGAAVDSYGCGDSFAAGFTYGLGAGLQADEAIALAARCGAVCLTGRGPYERQLSAAEVDG